VCTSGNGLPTLAELRSRNFPSSDMQVVSSSWCAERLTDIPRIPWAGRRNLLVFLASVATKFERDGCQGQRSSVSRGLAALEPVAEPSSKRTSAVVVARICPPHPARAMLFTLFGARGASVRVENLG
jgi:hypothetical protein